MSVTEETTAQQLKLIINSTRPSFCALPGYEGTSLGLFGRAMLNLDCDEVFPNLYVGDKNCALNKPYLARLGITHIMNAAEGNVPGMVDTNAHYYADVGINYLGKVLIHCEKGYSRSPTVALIYLALKVHLRIPMALRLCCSRRKICPNDGFLSQLSMLDNCLKSG
ncbi:dual specificity protein phosphatase 3-like [Thrips palmi]|uniref:protein-serine/threonine phosphatase n=1 Tax=Thrips palmi TaxID=161013 RepID=A0A6P8YQS2_THRPL|nr:dual specificity protein phosphatase 3-like [Thrips palmi]